ncbi:MAG: hypothetical protein AAF901_08465, partial [Bacteroidota bacterium]
MKQIYLSTTIIILCFSTMLSGQTEWTGPPTTFTKADFADWTDAANQDRITSNVWITRQNNQSIYNIVTESGMVGTSGTTPSPADTEWALGSISDGVSNLTFDRFVGTVSNFVGLNVLNTPMVLHLITDDIYIDITFTSWTSGNLGGGFSYTRSTDQTLSTNDLEREDVEIQCLPNPATDYITVLGLNNAEDYE